MRPRKLDSLQLADYIVAQLGKMTHLKLQKLVYYCEAYHLAYFDTSLIDDQFEAWLHGPVSRKLWNHLKPAANIYDDVTLRGKNKKAVIDAVKNKLTAEQLELLEDVFSTFGGKTAYYLECLTHSEDPWRLARIGYQDDDKCEEVIDKTVMRKYYKQFIC